MIGKIINPTTNETMVSKIRCPWRVVKDNKGNFVSISLIQVDTKLTELVFLTPKGYQFRFTSRIPRAKLEELVSTLI